MPATLPEGQSKDPSAHIRWFTKAFNSNSKATGALFSLHKHKYTQIYKLDNKINIFNFI